MEFSKIINVLIQNPWFIFISILIPITLSIIFFLKTIRRKSIRYCIKNNTLIEDFIKKIEDLNIEYSGKQINSLTVTKIAFWNNGTDTINDNDVPTNDHFTIVIENEFDILNASIIQVINQSNNVKVTLSNNRKIANIDFEYLDKNEGFVLQLFHNDTSSDRIHINGTIKGFGKISKGLINQTVLQKITKELFSPIFISAILAFIIFYSLFSNLHIIFFILLIVLLTVLLGYIKYKILYPVPRKLQKYFESII